MGLRNGPGHVASALGACSHPIGMKVYEGMIYTCGRTLIQQPHHADHFIAAVALAARKLKIRLSEFAETYMIKREAFEKCWAHSPLRAAVTVPFTRCR